MKKVILLHISGVVEESIFSMPTTNAQKKKKKFYLKFYISYILWLITLKLISDIM